MIFGIGIDLVVIERVERIWIRHGLRFAQRILSVNEYAEFSQQERQVVFLAKRFAVKEATVKAMGTGFSQGIGLQQIHLAHEASGKPTLNFSGCAEQFMRDHHIQSAHVSIADERAHVVACVLLEQEILGACGSSTK